MYRIPLPSPDASLLLSPRWGELPGPAQAALLSLLISLPVVLAIVLYRYELRLVRRSTALSLCSLRLVVLAFLIFLAGFQPIVARSSVEELSGRVLIALDRSASMDVADSHRPPVEKLKLARAVRLAGDLAPDSRLDEWIRHYAEKGGPQWLAPGEFPDDPERRQKLAEERRRPHDEVCRRVDQLTRATIGQRVLASEGVGLVEAVAARHKVELLGFAQEAWDLKGENGTSAEAIEKPPGAAANAASFQFTDLRLPLARALERSGADQARVLGVVVLTDGQHNWGPSPVAKAIELGERKLPVFPVALGSRLAPPDVALAAVRAPSAVFKDVDAPIEARLKVSGLANQEIVVELRGPDGVLQEERLRHDGSDRQYSVRFQTRLSQVGTQTLSVTARPVTGEGRTDNNSRPVAINVADDKARVLLVDGEVRWEYHYLASALQRDRTVQAEGVVFAQPRLGRIAEEDLHRIGNPRLTLPAEADALAGFDCIVLGDVSPAQLPPPDRIRLEKYVADRGGTLVILAGKRFMPHAFAGLPPAAEGGDPLLKLLPLETVEVVDPAKGFPLTFTHEGKAAPFLQLDAVQEKSDQRWAALPNHFWGVIGKVKPGAVPLACFFPDHVPLGKDLPAREREHALIVRQNYGFGRVLFIGVDSTWRWRFKVGDTYHHRFWGQVVRWAATDKPLVAGNEHVRFGAREPVYRQGQEVDLVVRLGDEVTPPRPGALAGARLLRQAGAGEEAVALVPLTRKDAQPRVLEGRVRDLPAGQYQVELVIPELADKLHGLAGPDGKPAMLRARFTVTAPDGDELVELATNWPLLEELAVRSGGRVFTPEDAGKLVDLLKQRSVTRELRSEHRLWQWWVMLVLLLGLLTIEWVGRKWAGLP